MVESVTITELRRDIFNCKGQRIGSITEENGIAEVHKQIKV